MIFLSFVSILTQAVLDAFKFSKLTSLPLKVREQYIEEEKRYDKFSEHTAKEIEKGKLEGIKEGELKAKMDMARKMILKGKTNDDILDVIDDLKPSKIDELRQTMADEQSKNVTVMIILEMTGNHYSLYVMIKDRKETRITYGLL